MSRPDPIQYAERLYAAIRDANFSTLSFLAFGNAVKDGVALRNMPRLAAEPFMRVVGEMLDLEEEAAQGDIIDADVTSASLPAAAPATANATQETTDTQPPTPASDATLDGIGDLATSVAPVNDRRRGTKR